MCCGSLEGERMPKMNPNPEKQPAEHVNWPHQDTCLTAPRPWRQELLLCLIAFALAAAGMLWAYASVGMAPWGDKTLLASDMKDQYAEFFCALKQGDLFFSWSKSLGTSYIGVFSYYVASPLSVITLFFPNEQMPLAILILAVMKIGLAGATCTFYFLRRFPKSALAALLSGLAWALMSYNAAYSLCIMWLDGVIWLPLVLLAVDRILDGRGFGPFVAALTVCFLSNWYVSYMVGGFSFLYFAAGLILRRQNTQQRIRAAGRFFGGALCGLGLTAWMWLPTFLAMFNGKFSGGNVDYDGLLTGEPLALLQRIWDGSYTSLTYTALPYVYCGIAAVVLAVVYLCQRHPWQERLVWFGLTAVMILSMLLSPLDKIWHVMQKPNWFPYRYGFLLSFCLLVMAAQAVPLMMDFLREHASPWTPRVVSVLLIAVVLADGAVHTRDIIQGVDDQFRYQTEETWLNDTTANEKLVAEAKADCADVFYRMGAYTDRGHNGPLAFGYAGITHYSSLYNYDVNQLLKNLGFAQTWMWSAYYGSTPVTDALLDIRYVLADAAPYEAMDAAGAYVLYKNPEVLPIAFLSQGTEAPALIGDSNPFLRQNALLAAITGDETPAFTPLNAEVAPGEDGGEVVITFVGTGDPVYADLRSSNLRRACLDGGVPIFLGSTEAASVHYLGTPAAGEIATLRVSADGSWGPPSEFLWALNRSVLSGGIASVQTAEVESVRKDGSVDLQVTAEDSRLLLTTIPAEDGWSVTVDGKKVEHSKWLDTFLAIPVESGTHSVQFRYTCPGLAPGIGAGVLAAIALVCAFLQSRRGAVRQKR